ncbi:hypothetical protein I4U23_010668 [Adineta vaga]|nr:hypothetical protein I4U23_010668 [Adineta vaga]
MSININLDQEWTCCSTTDDDNDLLNVNVPISIDESNWYSIKLPHIIDNNKSTNWWYRRQFDCTLSNEESTSSIYLTFKKSSNEDMKDENDVLFTQSIFVVVWLDDIRSFSGPLTLPHTSIKLPQKSLNSNHTLIICSMNTCLSFHVCLTIKDDKFHNKTNLTRQITCSDSIDEYVNIDLDSDQLIPMTILPEENKNSKSIPLLSIIMLIVGSRGDVQPFIAYGKVLRAFGHRVRLATHEIFRSFVREHGLEFYPLAGNPAEFMSFMVKNAGIVPSVNTLMSGNVFEGRRMCHDVLYSTWAACISNDDETGASFRAEAIIANPVSFGHIHCAQKLGVPLHMVFTMPYSPTTAFPHPLGNVNYTKESRERLNSLSYRFVETLLWLSIGDIINQFRRDILQLPSLNIRQATSIMSDEKVPYNYCWSPSLVPKPPDWPSYVNVSGFFFLDLATNYTTPSHELLKFLGLTSQSNGETREISPPIFIGFGSITGHDSRRFLNIILEALMLTGYRAILAGFDIDDDQLPKTVFKIDDVPYDWLFEYVSAVCHHGGAGTTAAGLRAGKPTIVIPFFGDQFFWANIVKKSGAGPPPLSEKDLTVDQLVEAFKFVHKPLVQAAAQRIKEVLLNEDGCQAAVTAFHSYLPLSRMRSDLESTYAACFRLDDFNLQISRPVAQVLLSAGVITELQLRYHSSRNWLASQRKSNQSEKANHVNLTDFQLNSTTPSILTDYYGLKNNNNNTHIDNSQVILTRRRASSSDYEGSSYTNPTSSFSKSIDITLPATFQLASSSILSKNDDQQQSTITDTISKLAHDAATISGFSPEVCEDILLQFDRIQGQRAQQVNMTTTTISRHYQRPVLNRQRSRSSGHL